MPAANLQRKRSPRKGTAEAWYDEAEVVERIREVCGRRTTAQLELLTGMHAETIRRQVRGLVRPSVEFVGRLCAATGVSSEWVLFGIEPRLAEGRSPRKVRAPQVG